MNICPDYNSEYYKDLVKVHGVEKAPMIWFSQEISNLSGEKLFSPDKLKGGFSNAGKGTPLGDGKDKAMRKVADNFIGEIVKKDSSSYTSFKQITDKLLNDEATPPIINGVTHAGNLGVVTMLARNSEFKGKELAELTKQLILDNYNFGGSFVVGDMPDVDTQFIDYLEEIKANYTIYHAGEKSRINPKNKDKVNKAVSKKQKEVLDKRVMSNPKIKGNKEVTIETSDEQKRLYNIQKVDFEGNFIPNDFIEIKTQNDAIDSIFSLSYLTVLKTPINKREALTEEKLVDVVLDNITYLYNNLIDIEDLSEEEQQESNFYQYLPYINMYEEIVTARQQFKTFALQRFEKVKLDIKRLAEEIAESIGDETNDRTSYKNSEERDPKETMSDRVKLFLSTTIEHKYVDGKSVPVKNSIGFDQIVNDSIYEKLLQLFSNKPNLTLGEIVSTLKKDEAKQPTLYNLGLRIESDLIEDRVKNEIVSAFKKVNLKSYVTQYSKDENTYSFMTFEGNRNSYLRKIIEIWKQEQKLNGALLSYDEENNIAIDDNKVNDLYNRVLLTNQDVNSTTNDYALLLDEVINGLGITLSDLAKSDIKNQVSIAGSIFDRYNNKTLKEQFEFTDKGEPIGLFSDILYTLKGKSKFNVDDSDNKDSKLIIRNPLYVDDKAVRFLGEIQGKYSDIITSTHTTVEGKKTYDYLLPAYQYTELLKAKFSEEYRDELEKDIFVGNSFIFRKILNDDKIRADYEIGLFEAIKNEKSKKGVTRSNMSDRENIMSDFHNFLNNDSAEFANYFDLTKSDKSTSPFHYKVPKINTEAEIVQEYFNIFNAEYLRIKNKDKIRTLSGQLNKGAGMFFLLPMFNYEMMMKMKQENKITDDEIKMIWEDSETINKDITIDNEKFMNLFSDIVLSMVNNKVASFVETIQSESIPISFGDEISDSNIFKYIANKHIFNISLAMFYSGDPASFYKGKTDDVVKNINATYDEYTKRLAKDIAPGIAGNYQKEDYTAITIEVPNTYTKEYSELLLKEYYGAITNKDGSIKGQIDSSDASQFSSVKRFFQILYDYGRVPTRIYEEIQNRTNPNELLTDEQLSYIAPLKPVEVNRNSVSLSKKETYSYVNYVKSFLMPLVPNIVNDTNMEQMMLMMDKHGIDQVSLDSAGKSGNPVKMLKPFDIDNQWVFKSGDTKSIGEAKRIMSADSFLIQQELPYDETKEKITFITQLNKLILDTISFIPDSVFYFQGEYKTGEQMAQLKEDIRKNILDISFEELKSEFGIDAEGNIDKNKIVEYIIRTSDDLTINQKEELKLDTEGNFVIPLMFNRSSNQIQSKITSAIRKAIQVKINGKSFVQAASLGIGKLDMTGEIPNQVIRTKNWNGDKLSPLRPVISELYSQLGIEVYLTQNQLEKAKKKETFKLTDEQKQMLSLYTDEIESNPNIGLTKDYSIQMLPAEVLVPFNFFNSNGERMNINDFMVDGVVDIDEELLKLVGARIPNQSHSSQLPIKIVGFIPSIGGDIMYVPAEITKQMGSDFDVDKLYVYKKKYSYYKSSEKIDKLKVLDTEIEKITNTLDKIKLSEEEYKKVTNAQEEYMLSVNSEMFLEQLKETVVDDKSVNLKNKEVADFFNNLTLQQVEDFKYLTYKKNKEVTSVGERYKDKNIANLVTVIKQKSTSLKNLIYKELTSELLDSVDRKKKFKDKLKELKEKHEERKSLNKEIKSEPYNRISSDLFLDNYGELDEDIEMLEVYKNDYFDVLYSILTSPNMFEKVMQPLDMDDLKDVVSMRNSSAKSSEIKDLFDPINQIKSYSSNVGVKALVGTFSLNLTFNTLLQRTKNINLKQHKVTIGGLRLNTFSGLGRSEFKKIDKKEKISFTRTTSDNIIIPQSEAVDHAKNQIADKVNLNSFTANAYSVILQLKNEQGKAVGNEYASQLINNNVVKQYVNNLKTFQDGFSDGKGSDGKKEAYEKTLMDLGYGEDIIEENYKKSTTDYFDVNLSDIVLGIKRDKEGYITSIEEPNKKFYIGILNSFIELDKIGSEFFQMLIATNFDTKGVGTNLLEGMHKKQLVESLKTETNYISNFNNLLLNADNSANELGHTIDLSVDVLDSLSKLFDYDILDRVVSKITAIKGGKELRPNELRSIITNFQSYVYSFPVMWNNIETEKFRLLYSKENLAIRLEKMKQKYPEYLLFKKLELKLADNKEDPNYISYRTLDIEQDSQYIYNEFFSLTASSKADIGNFMVDLVKYAYLTGGVSNFNSFVNLIPPSFIEKLLSQSLKEVLVSQNFNEEGFVRQYFQHNPEEAVPHSIYLKGTNKFREPFNNLNAHPTLNLTFPNIEEDEPLPRFVYMKGGTYDGKKKTFLYEKAPNTFNKYIQLDTLGDYNSNEYNYMKEFAQSYIPINKSMVSSSDLYKFFEKSIMQNRINNDSLNSLITVSNGDLTNVLFFASKKESQFKELSNILFLHHKIGTGRNAKIQVSSDNSSYNGKIINVSSESEDMMKDLMHEILHHETYNYLQDNNNIVTYKLDLIRKQAIENLSANEKKIIAELEKVNAYDKLDLLEKLREDNNLTYSDISKLYYLSNIHELVTGAFTDSDFQLFLNNIKDNSENQNLFTKFKLWIDRLIIEIANNIGIKVDRESLLYSIIEQVFETFESEIKNEANIDKIFSQSDITEAKQYVKQCK